MTTERPADEDKQSPASGHVSYAILDQALWTHFANATSVEDFVGAWLAILCRGLPGAAAAIVLLGEPEAGTYLPLARWPDDGEPARTPALAADQALAKRQPVMSRRPDGTDVALPLIVDGALYGAVALAIDPDGAAPAEVVRQLRWASGWIEVLLRREQNATYARLQDRTATALDLLGTVLEQGRFAAACQALATELARRLDCDPVSIGFLRGRNARVVAMSHAAGFGKRMSVVRDVRGAMNEAIDQAAIVLYPPRPGWDYRVSLSHEELVAAHKAESVLTVPIQHDRRIVGAITLERSRGSFDDETVQLCDAVATVVGPVLEEKRRNDRPLVVKALEAGWSQISRLLGPSHVGRKLATLVFLGLAGYFATATTTFTVTAPAELQGEIQRTLVAPFNGYLAAQKVRAGAVVSAGEELARLDDRDLALERLRLVTSRSQRQAEYDQALASRERAQANIIETQILQIDSQIALVDEQIARTVIVAPFDGVVVSGDLSQSIGATIERGQELFQIAPLDAYRVLLEVDERDIALVAEGQTGQLRLAPLPDLPLDYRIERITPVSEQREGRNFFRVEAALETDDPRLRPSMEGIARTVIDERLLIAAWTRAFTDWARLALWRWMP